ncbi:MAG: sugar ABC transporter permease [Candidatus Sumerlaeia bacterium]
MHPGAAGFSLPTAVLLGLAVLCGSAGVELLLLSFGFGAGRWAEFGDGGRWGRVLLVLGGALGVAAAVSDRRLRARLTPWWFVLPALVLFGMFSWRPILYSFWVSVLDYKLGTAEHTFVGLENFRYVLGHKDFLQIWINVGVFVGLAMVIGYPTPIILAVMINEMRRSQWWFRLGYYLPVILPLVVVALMWKFLYAPYEGLFDSLLRWAGLEPVEWLQNEKTAMLSLVLMSTWKNAGGAMIIYLAALQGVAPQLYEAAEIDGAGVWQRLRYITIPGILPIMMILFILQIIGTFQVFVEPFLMTGGGPNQKTYTPLYFIYDLGFTRFDYGAGSAMGLILFAVLLGFTVVYFRLQRKWSGG